MDKHKEWGFTYIEMIICIGIVSCLIGPLSQAFLSAIRTRVSANRIEEATSYIEQLMMEVKDVMSTEELLQQSGKVTSEDVKEQNVLNKERGYVSTNLEDLLCREKRDKKLETHYQMDQYAYEVAIWHEQDLIGSGGTIQLDGRDLKQSIRFYSDEEAESLFREESGENNLVNLKIENTSSKILEENKWVNWVTVCFTADGQVSEINHANEQSNIKVSLAPNIETKGKEEICHLKIEEGSQASKGEGLNIIELDCSTLSIKQPLKVKLTNDTRYNQLIQIRQRIDKNNEEDIEQGDAQSWDVMVEDRGRGKSTVIHTDHKVSHENYVIIIRIKDKQPVQGEEGKVLKQMIDMYN